VIEVTALLVGIPVGVCALLAWTERPRWGSRYSGRTYDPQPRIRVRRQADKSGMRATHAAEAAVRLGMIRRKRAA
jgi:hypothetical protein